MGGAAPSCVSIQQRWNPHAVVCLRRLWYPFNTLYFRMRPDPHILFFSENSIGHTVAVCGFQLPRAIFACGYSEGSAWKPSHHNFPLLAGLKHRLALCDFHAPQAKFACVYSVSGTICHHPEYPTVCLRADYRIYNQFWVRYIAYSVFILRVKFPKMC